MFNAVSDASCAEESAGVDAEDAKDIAVKHVDTFLQHLSDFSFRKDLLDWRNDSPSNPPLTLAFIWNDADEMAVQADTAVQLYMRNLGIYVEVSPVYARFYNYVAEAINEKLGLEERPPSNEPQLLDLDEIEFEYDENGNSLADGLDEFSNQAAEVMAD